MSAINRGNPIMSGFASHDACSYFWKASESRTEDGIKEGGSFVTVFDVNADEKRYFGLDKPYYVIHQRGDGIRHGFEASGDEVDKLIEQFSG